ncbi:MAG: 30S ribosomal protein S20 [Desulfomonilia bacterium]
MANHPSALKRQRQSTKRRLRNKSYKSAINTSVKKIYTALEEKNPQEATENFKHAIKKLESAVNKGILHRKTASRRISKLTKTFQTEIS